MRKNNLRIAVGVALRLTVTTSQSRFSSQWQFLPVATATLAVFSLQNHMWKEFFPRILRKILPRISTESRFRIKNFVAQVQTQEMMEKLVTENGIEVAVREKHDKPTECSTFYNPVMKICR